MKVKRNTLLLLACLVWSAAGFNIFRIGLEAYPAHLTVWNCLLSVLVFVAGLLFGCNYGRAVFAATVQNKIEHKGE